MAVAITATTQDVYPPRVQLAVTGLTGGDVVTIWRFTGGVRTAVRGAFEVTVTDTSLVRVDAELPFGTAVTHIAEVDGVDEDSVGPTSYTLTGGKVALSDAITGEAAEVVILSWPEKITDPKVSVFKVGGRNVVVSGDFGQFEGDVELYVDATSSSENVRALLTSATQGVIQVRQPGGYAGVDSYVAVTSAAERRWSQDGSDARRVWALHLVETEAWSAELEATGYTYADLADAYTGLTYADLAADWTTYLDLATGFEP